MLLPKARNADILVQETGKELLVYDLRTHKAFNLNQTSKIVFESCDGKTSFDEFRRKHKFTDDLIYFALDDLKRENLIEGEPSNHFGNLSRREVIRKVGLASMIALPLITGLIAPTAAQAVSCVGSGGTSNASSTADNSLAAICQATASSKCCNGATFSAEIGCICNNGVCDCTCFANCA